jgi:apoptosis-inducing factor 2
MHGPGHSVGSVGVKRIVIIGGGYAGTMLARALDAIAEIVMVEPREAFVHNVAAIRAIVDSSLLDRIVIPYDRLLKRGRIIRDRAVGIDGNAVRLAANGAVEGDIVVAATGSSYAQPFKPAGDRMSDFRTASLAAHEALKAARSVAIVGAGAVGTELAGEIAAGMHGKRVTLVSATASLFPDFPPKLGKRLEAELKRLGVALRMGVMAHGLSNTDRPGHGPLQLSDGTSLDADLVFPVIGSKPVGDVLRSLPGAGFDPAGRVLVDGWLRPAARANLFALGDAAATGEMMTIVAVTRQAPWLARTITAMIAGKRIEDLPRYTPWPAPPILIPLGPRRGASVLPVMNAGVVVGNALTAAIKGKALFIPRYHKDFGV